jgi:glycosyltransferase involved in cell wall biosynthesis
VARVTIVTAAYNAAPYIAEAIESVLAQTYRDFDYIVVDDGSSDETAAVIERYLPAVTLIRQSNAGEGAARNRAFELADGEYIAVVDADDVWEPTKLERQVAAMDEHSDAGLCYTNAVKIGADGSTLDASMVPPHSRLSCLMVMTGRNPIVTSSVVFRRRFLEARPYIDLLVSEDYYVNLMALWRCGERSVFVDEPLVRYRVVDSSLLRSVDGWLRGQCTMSAVESFIDEMRVVKPVPAKLQRQGIAPSHFMWAWYFIDGRTHYGFALGELARAVRNDPTLTLRAGRQVVKLAATRLGLR